MHFGYLIFFLCSVLTVIGQAEIIAYNNPYMYLLHSNYLSTPSQQQYHTKDIFGQYSYGYNEPLSSKHEERSLDGVTRGAYSYRDANGKLQQVQYTADEDGFHVAASNLPKATLEVAAARKNHLAAHDRLRLANSNTYHNLDNTALVQTKSLELSKNLKPTTNTPANVRELPIYREAYTTNNADLSKIYKVNYPLHAHFLPTNFIF